MNTAEPIHQKFTLVDGGIYDYAENVSISLLVYFYLVSEKYVLLNFCRLMPIGQNPLCSSKITMQETTVIMDYILSDLVSVDQK